MATLPTPGGDSGTWGDELNTYLQVEHAADGTHLNILSGTGSPEGVVTGTVGQLFRRTDGGTGTALYVKESGTGNTGWVAVAAAGAVAASAVSVDSTTLVGTGVTAQAVFEEIDNGIADHLADTSAAHAASAVSADSTTLVGVGTDVQAVLEELDNAVVAAETATSNHLSDTSAAHAASAISADSTTLVGTATDVQAVLEELDNGIADHLADTSAAHAASAISIADAANDFTATDVEGALAELQSDAEGDATALSDHIADTAAAHAASAISVNSTTLVGTGTDVQAVFEELDNGIADHLADTSAAHAASAISVDSTTLEGTGTDVQAVFEELDNAKSNKLLVENVQTASYGLVLADADLCVVMNVGTANNLTVPLNATQAFATGTVIAIHQRGAGQTTVVATGGVTINSPSAKLKLTGQYSSAALRKYGTDTWVLTGDIAA